MPLATKPALGLGSNVVATASAAGRRLSGSSALAARTSALANGSNRSKSSGSISFSRYLAFAVGLELGQDFGMLLEKRSEIRQRVQGIRAEVMLDALDVAGLRIVVEVK